MLVHRRRLESSLPQPVEVALHGLWIGASYGSLEPAEVRAGDVERAGGAVGDPAAEQESVYGASESTFFDSEALTCVGGRNACCVWLVETRGFEPLTPCVQSRCSPAELRPH